MDLLPEVGERLDMRIVHRFIVLFVPTRHSAYAVTPLVNAALYLITAVLPSVFKVVMSEISSYQRKGKGNCWDWYRGEIFMEDNAVGIFVLKPHDIDNLLDDRMSIWVKRSPASI